MKTMKTIYHIKNENIVYLDIETQYIMTDFNGGWKNKDNYKNVKIAVLGILRNGKYTTFEEDNLIDLVWELAEAELIVGHNIIQFDYRVLKCYMEYVTQKIIPKTFDTMIEFNKFTPTAGWISLNDIAKRNFGMSKTEESIKIPELWRNGERDKVKEYLLNDLKMTEQFYLLGRKGHTFKYEHKHYGKSFGEREVYIRW